MLLKSYTIYFYLCKNATLKKKKITFKCNQKFKVHLTKLKKEKKNVIFFMFFSYVFQLVIIFLKILHASKYILINFTDLINLASFIILPNLVFYILSKIHPLKAQPECHSKLV